MAKRKRKNPPIPVTFYHHGFLWWIVIGWWWRPIRYMWLMFVGETLRCDIEITHLKK